MRPAIALEKACRESLELHQSGGTNAVTLKFFSHRFDSLFWSVANLVYTAPVLRQVVLSHAMRIADRHECSKEILPYWRIVTPFRPLQIFISTLALTYRHITITHTIESTRQV